jgi:hypothetical protein
VIGRFKAEDWTDRNGVVRTGLEISANAVAPMKPKGNGAEVVDGRELAEATFGPAAFVADPTPADGDDLPF